MNSIEKRARELLANEHRHDQRRAKGIRIGHKSVSRDDHLAVCAIIAALTPAEDYVLVPVEPTTAMMEAAGRVVFQEAGQQWSDSAGFAEAFVVDTQRLCHAAMLAARPDVP